MNIVAKSKTQEVYEFLKEYQGLTNPNSLKFLAWLKDGEALLKTDPADGYILQGFAYGLLGNPLLAIESMKKAMLLNNYFGKINYAMRLSYFGNFQESYEICLELLKQNPLDKQAFDVALDNAGNLINHDLLEKVAKLFKGDIKGVSSVLSYIQDKQLLLTDLNISKDIFLKIQKVLFQFLSYHYYGDYTAIPIIRQTELGKHLELNIYLNHLEIEKCLEMNELFLEKLINNNELHYDEYKNIIVQFMPAEYSDGKVA